MVGYRFKKYFDLAPGDTISVYIAHRNSCVWFMPVSELRKFLNGEHFRYSPHSINWADWERGDKWLLIDVGMYGDWAAMVRVDGLRGEEIYSDFSLEIRNPTPLDRILPDRHE